MGTGLAEVNEHTTFNIKGQKQCDPWVLHDTVEAVEGESDADVTE